MTGDKYSDSRNTPLMKKNDTAGTTRIPRIAVLIAGHGVILTKTVDFMLAHRGQDLAQGLIWFILNSAMGLIFGYVALTFADMPNGTIGAQWFRIAESLCRLNFMFALFGVLLAAFLWSRIQPA